MFHEPSQRLDSSWYKEISLQTLRNILEFGLLLCPENKDFACMSDTNTRDLRSNLERTSGSGIKQIRACFTLAENAEELARTTSSGESHRDLFGDIGLAISPTVGRALGAVPCHYYPEEYVPDASHFLPFMDILRSRNSGEIRNLTQIRDVLMLLAVLEAIAKGNEPPKIAAEIPNLQEVEYFFPKISTLSKEKSDKLFESISKTELALASKFLKPLEFPRLALLNLAWKIEGLLDTMQTIDSGNRKVEFGYFDQREWRIPLIQHKGLNLSCLDINSDPFKRRTEDEKATTKQALDAVERILTFRPDTDIKIREKKDYWIHWGMKADEYSKGKPIDFALFIDRIWCPQPWKSEVSGLLNEVWREKKLYDRIDRKMPCVKTWNCS